MSHPGARSGHPFDGEFPDRQLDQAGGLLRQAVQRQVRELQQRRSEPGFRRQLISALQRRRAGRSDLLQFDALYTDLGFDTLVLRGELITTCQAYQDSSVRSYLDNLGMQEWDPGCSELAKRVVRLGNPELDATTLDDSARMLRLRGISASVNHVAPLGPVGKGLGGPEPATALELPRMVAGRPSTTPIRVAVIDTGITEKIRSDGWLADIPRGENIDLLDDLPHGPDGFLDFGAGHGTFVGGIVQQICPNADIRMYRALDSDGIGSEIQVAAAMVQAVQDGCQVLNLSLGTQTRDNQQSLPMAAALDAIAELERQRGEEVVIVAAAGNFADTTPCWPAAFRRVAAVSALGPDLLPAPWATHGFWVSFSTIGQGVTSTYVEGQESFDVDPKPDTFGTDAWAAWSGTSFAAPQVAGAVARLAQEQKITPAAALAELRRLGNPVPGYGQALRILPGL